MPAYSENEILVTPNATTSLLSTGMLDREKQAKKQQDTEYEEAGGRANFTHSLKRLSAFSRLDAERTLIEGRSVFVALPYRDSYKYRSLVTSLSYKP